MVSAGYGVGRPQPRRRVADRAGADGLRRRHLLGALGRRCAVGVRGRRLRLALRLPWVRGWRRSATTTTRSESRATHPTTRSRRPSGGSRASCTPTSTRTTRRRPSASARWPRRTRCWPTPTRAAATTGTATPASRATTRAPTQAFQAGQPRRPVLDAVRRGHARLRRRTGGGAPGPMAGADAAAQTTISLHDAAFGVRAEVETEVHAPCERCEQSGAEPGTLPGHLHRRATAPARCGRSCARCSARWCAPARARSAAAAAS